ncbi:MAG TPA: serine hydrolase [Bryobacteraceae bacterium]|nr:serine hydrolase [Bryobacteraceae bacterium]
MNSSIRTFFPGLLLICLVCRGQEPFLTDRLAKVRDDLASRGTKALLIIADGRTRLEWYVPGASATTKHYTASLAKALVGGTSLLVAAADGRIRPEQRAAEFIPGWSEDSRKRSITIRQLATHTSGLEDAEQNRIPHAQLTGWKGDFWKRDPDPFTIAIRAPVLFEPGTSYHYSNPGMAALAWAVTASLQRTPHPDIRTLLRERVFRRIGISDDEWSIGYGAAYEVNGLSLWANWGGGSFTPRAVTRIGEWMMNKGRWGREQPVPERFVESALRYAGTALPARDRDRYAPATVLGWYTNIDRVWPALPPDAFAGAGAGHQLLLVVPSLRLIVVRNGAALEPRDQFWTAAYKQVFEPVVAALRDPLRPLAAPYPPSSVIRGVTFDSEIIRRAIGSDNWPITWAADDHLYAAWGDGWGFEPLLPQKLSLGLSRVEGTPSEFRGINIRSASLEQTGDGPAGPKASGIISVDGILYMWVRNVENAQLLWSEDNGQHWTWGFKLTESFGSPTFLNFGRDNRGARDEYVYTYSQDGPSAYNCDNSIVLARCHKTGLRDRQAWEYFTGTGWSRAIEARKAVFVFPDNCQRTDAVYNSGLKRYLLTVAYGHNGGWGIYDAPEPWGPWTTAFHTEYWGLGQSHGYRIPSKWISEDGRTLALVFSGLIYNTVSYDAFCVRRMRLHTR